jgi:hypothetical protein
VEVIGHEAVHKDLERLVFTRSQKVRTDDVDAGQVEEVTMP